MDNSLLDYPWALPMINVDSRTVAATYRGHSLIETPGGGYFFQALGLIDCPIRASLLFCFAVLALLQLFGVHVLFWYGPYKRPFIFCTFVL